MDFSDLIRNTSPVNKPEDDLPEAGKDDPRSRLIYLTVKTGLSSLPEYARKLADKYSSHPTFISDAIEVLEKRTKKSWGSDGFFSGCAYCSESANTDAANFLNASKNLPDEHFDFVWNVYNDHYIGRYGSAKVQFSSHQDLIERATKQYDSIKALAPNMYISGYKFGEREEVLRFSKEPLHDLKFLDPTGSLGNGATAIAFHKMYGDLTYIWTGEGFMYLAVFIDLFSRKVVGWALGVRLTTALVLQALRQAIMIRNPPAGLLIHTDRGSQYTSDAFISLAEAEKLTLSMSRKGNCWDNCVVESFFASLKRECIKGEKIFTRTQLLTIITDYIDGYYNTVRMHSTLDYLSPMEYEFRAA